jgi:transcription termination factor Rho
VFQDGKNKGLFFGTSNVFNAERLCYFALVKVYEVNDEDPDNVRNRIPFASLTPLHPEERISLEIGNGGTEDITARVIDLVAPFGKGQRGLLVAPPKAGKTMIMQNIASSISRNHPECELIVLLIDERPEEVTEMARTVRGEVVASTFDESAKRHVQVAPPANPFALYQKVQQGQSHGQ